MSVLDLGESWRVYHTEWKCDSGCVDVINTTLIVTNIPYIIMALGVFFGLIFTWLACRGQGSTDEVSSGCRNVCLTGLCSLRTSAVLH